MKRLIAIGALLLMVPALASAQDGSHQYRGQGYVFVGEGAYSDDYGLHRINHVGGGGEVLLFRGFAVGEELGVLGRLGQGVGVLSIDPSYHFLHASSKSKVVPFVEGGYTRTFGNNDPLPPSNLFNFGGGIHYWAFKRVGLRLEFRDHIYHGQYYSVGLTHHFWGLRIGLAMR